ncbi:DUF2254 domain-containing protein [Pseudoroseicyclus sp. H15]
MASLIGISESLARKVLALWRTLWIRVVLMGLLALASIGVTQIIGPLLPDEWMTYVTGTATDRLLDIIANAMLAVTTFSLTVMVSVYAFSAQQWTPRVHRLIIQDPTTQNTLATFIGAYVYALVAIILREVRVFPDDAALVLFVLTVAVLVLIVFALIRWTLHLQGFGSLDTTARQVEEITRRELRNRTEQPCLGGTPLFSRGDIPKEARPLKARKAGYVKQIYQDKLHELAEEHDLQIWISQPPGHFVHLEEAMFYVSGAMDEELEEQLRNHVVTSDTRGYMQDPRLGLIVMSEIGSKALSPGINDPGTAIDAMTRIARLLGEYQSELGEHEPEYPRLHVLPLQPEDVLEDGFGAMARDGAARLDVQQRLQDILAGLMSHPDKELSRAARAMAVREFRRAMQTLDFAPDREQLTRSAHPDVVADARAEMEGERG